MQGWRGGNSGKDGLMEAVERESHPNASSIESSNNSSAAKLVGVDIFQSICKTIITCF